MNEKQLQAWANEPAKNLKIPGVLSQFDRLLKKISVEATLTVRATIKISPNREPTPATAILQRPFFGGNGEDFICKTMVK
ncbi:hypothetical protein [Klebsiella indica]|uniref:hypothetical protein n=1 Tax=Klebsiella indica TaxID=2582917 RepID=UPI0014870E94|nr:hypothetical protein [Klebsiella indica]